MKINIDDALHGSRKIKHMLKTIMIIAMLLVFTSAEVKATEATIAADYAHALETANTFLSAWAARDVESGSKLISRNLLSKLKKENKIDWFKQYMSGLSNPHHLSFEIAKGKQINPGRFAFPVTLYEYYAGSQKAFQYKSKLEILKEGESWIVDLLPITSDNE